MESQGKMLVALSLIAVLAGFSAIGYVAVQNNANLASIASSTPTGFDPSAAGSAIVPTTTSSGTSSGGTPLNSAGVGSSCSTTQDCIDAATAAGTCKPTAACTVTCVSGSCIGASAPQAPVPPAGGNIPMCATKPMGDFDCSGKTDCADLKLFISELAGIATTKNSDVNGDSKVSLADFEMVRVASGGAGGGWASCQL